jgi:hypothetical protein
LLQQEDTGLEKRVGNAEGAGAFRSFSRVMFKILHITSNILNVKLDEEEEGL